MLASENDGMGNLVGEKYKRKNRRCKAAAKLCQQIDFLVQLGYALW